MNCKNIQIDCAETINIILSSIIGIGLAYFTAWSYENFKNKRQLKNKKKTCQFLEIKNENFNSKHCNKLKG